MMFSVGESNNKNKVKYSICIILMLNIVYFAIKEITDIVHCILINKGFHSSLL
jgi:hypothetical protein